VGASFVRAALVFRDKGRVEIRKGTRVRELQRRDLEAGEDGAVSGGSRWMLEPPGT
jgi:hypothetical protein